MNNDARLVKRFLITALIICVALGALFHGISRAEDEPEPDKGYVDVNIHLLGAQAPEAVNAGRRPSERTSHEGPRGRPKTTKEGLLVISLIGEMDAYDAEGLENEVLGVIKKGEKQIVIDFKELNYISSSGLRALLNIRGQLVKEGGRLKLAGLKDKVLEVFRVSKLLNIFEIAEEI